MKIFFIIFFAPFQLCAQDITGIWTGTVQTAGNEMPYEIVISQNKDKLSGYSLMTFSINGAENTGIKSIKPKIKNGNVLIEDEELIYNNYSTPPKRVKLFSNLLLTVQGSVMMLSGSFKTKAMDFRASDNLSYSGTMKLIKQTNTAKTKLMIMLEKLNLLGSLTFLSPISKREEPIATIVSKEDPEPAAANKKEMVSAAPVNIKNSVIDQPAKINTDSKNQLSFPAQNMDSLLKESIIIAAKERKTSVVRTVFFAADSLVLSLYDNGIVDGDTVSIVLNGRVILANQGLTTKAIRYVVYTTPELGDSLLFTMVAENLGSSPPNTGLLIVEDGDNRNEITFSGDMQMSSAILFRRKH